MSRSRFSPAPSAEFRRGAARLQSANNQRAMLDMMSGLAQAGRSIGQGFAMERREKRADARAADSRRYNERNFDLQQRRIEQGDRAMSSREARLKRSDERQSNLDQIAEASRQAEMMAKISGAGFNVEGFRHLHPLDQARLAGEASGRIMDQSRRRQTRLDEHRMRTDAARAAGRDKDRAAAASQAELERQTRLDVANVRANAPSRSRAPLPPDQRLLKAKDHIAKQVLKTTDPMVHARGAAQLARAIMDYEGEVNQRTIDPNEALQAALDQLLPGMDHTTVLSIIRGQ